MQTLYLFIKVVKLFVFAYHELLPTIEILDQLLACLELEDSLELTCLRIYVSYDVIVRSEEDAFGIRKINVVNASDLIVFSDHLLFQELKTVG